MSQIIGKIRRKIRRRFSPFKIRRRLIAELEQSKQRQVHLQREVQRCRAMLRRLNNTPIHVVFVCHQPSIWGKLSPVFEALRHDPDFAVSAVVVPYKHHAHDGAEFFDTGMADLLREQHGVEPIFGFDKATGRWIDLQDLSPDFVFFQTPYDNQFLQGYSSTYVASYARICYVPYYGILLYRDDVASITHPAGFLENTSIVFVANEKERQELLEALPEKVQPPYVAVVGSPMFDYMLDPDAADRTGWNRPEVANTKRILWTPRWRTSEGNCHFFDYKDYLLSLARSREDIDFLFRPHPLMLPNLATTGEFPKDQQQNMLDEFAKTHNAGIDFSRDYHSLFLSSDILVSDMSSMMGEFFVTGKPVVYTHRVDTFNEVGSKMARGFYWVKSEQELDECLRMLLLGHDPLRATREAIIKDLIFVPEEGSSSLIGQILKSRFDDAPDVQPEGSRTVRNISDCEQS